MSSKQDKRFKTHYTRLVQPIFRFIYYKCGDRVLAEDIAQDTFIRFWNKIETVKEGGESAYIYRIAKNLLINHGQKQKVSLKFQQTLRQNQENHSPQFLLEEKEFKQKVERAISNLSEKQREVFLMNRIDGLKYREIAERLDISQKAVEKRMQLALLALKKIHKKI